MRIFRKLALHKLLQPPADGDRLYRRQLGHSIRLGREKGDTPNLNVRRFLQDLKRSKQAAEVSGK
jgi:hypothetical protein